MQSQNDDVKTMLNEEEWFNLVNGRESLLSLIRIMTESRNDRINEYRSLFRDDRVVATNVKLMYQSLIERKQKILDDLVEETRRRRDEWLNRPSLATGIDETLLATLTNRSPSPTANMGKTSQSMPTPIVRVARDQRIAARTTRQTSIMQFTGPRERNERH